MQIEEGKYYRDVQGVKRGPAVRVTDSKWPWALGDGSGYYFDDGTCPYISEENLVAEWTDEPATIISEIEDRNQEHATTQPTNTDLAVALREIADTLPLGSALIVRLAADRLVTGETGDGWIAHDGKAIPKLPDGSKVGTRHRSGEEYSGKSSFSVNFWSGPGFWIDDGTRSVITHYRVEPPPERGVDLCT